MVCSGNHGRVAPFIQEQMDGVAAAGVTVVWFLIQGRGMAGYLRELPRLRQVIAQEQPDVIHAHYGLSGVLSNLQRRVPVVTTYHGSDINVKRNLRISQFAIRYSAYNIFVSQRLMELAHPKAHYQLLPCGVNCELFQPMAKAEARQRLGWDLSAPIVLFAGAFDVAVKNSDLAKEAVALLPDVTLKELKGYSREEMVWVMNGADSLLMTSHSEGSPQVVKEALACGCPVVSVDVGDVKEIVGLSGHGDVVDKDSIELSKAVSSILNEVDVKEISMVDSKYDNQKVISQLYNIYKEQLK